MAETKRISGCWDVKGRIRCETGRPGEEPRIEAAEGDTVVACHAGVDGSHIEFIVGKVETRLAGNGVRPLVWYTPVAGTVRAYGGGFTPESSEEQLSRSATREARRTGELPGA